MVLKPSRPNKKERRSQRTSKCTLGNLSLVWSLNVPSIVIVNLYEEC